MRIVFIGPPGSGKGTQCQRLEELLGLVHLSTGEMLRDAIRDGNELGRIAAGYLDSGNWVPDDVILQCIVDRLTAPDCADGFLLDGFPRTVPQAEAFDTLLEERRLPLDCVVSLEVPEEVLRKRLLARGRHDDTEETISERFRNHDRLTEPLIEYFREKGILRRVDGQGTPAEVFDRIKEAIGLPNT